MPIYKTKKRDTRTYLDRMENEKDRKYEQYNSKQDPIKEIMKFQTDRLLHKQEYDNTNEATSVTEEILESLGFNVPKNKRQQLQNEVLSFVSKLQELNITKPMKELTIHEKIDAHADQIVFNIGAIMKLGYDPKLVLSETAKEINSRKGAIVDGKFEKYTKDHPNYEVPYKADYTKSKIK